MTEILKLNSIAGVVKENLPEDKYTITDDAKNPAGIIIIPSFKYGTTSAFSDTVVFLSFISAHLLPQYTPIHSVEPGPPIICL